MKKPLSIRKAELAFGFAILVLLAVGAISYRAILSSNESDRWVRHSHEVLENIQNSVLAMEGINSSYRGFVLTGDQAYLKFYRNNIVSLEQYEAAIRELTGDNPAQQQRLPALVTVGAKRIAFAETVIGLRRAQGLEPAVNAMRSGPGQRFVDEFQGIARELRDEELRLLMVRDADAKRRLGQTKVILVLGSFLGFLIVSAAGWSVHRENIRRELAEEALRAGEARYRGLLEAAPDAMLVANQNGDIVLFNLQAERQFGYQRDELMGQKVTNIIPEGFAERLIADALRSAEDAQTQQIGSGIKLSGRRKDGSEFPIEIMLSPLESAKGIFVTVAIRDITARKKAEAHLLRNVEELKRSNEELGQFAYVASHDLQEPLRMVASYTQLLSSKYKGKLDADADEFIGFAVDGASRMQRLIQDLLEYSRVGTKGKVLINASSEEALQQALVNLSSAIEESGAQVTHGPLPAVLADETQLVQLFQNLVGNGIKYQSTGIPRVHISAVKNGGAKWTFSVQDNGLGIDPQYFEKIFGMFQRLHKREEFAGTGIGLAICKKIAERHGGNIAVESQPGKGSTFRFALTASGKN